MCDIASADSDIQVGDIVTHIRDVKSIEHIQEMETLISGSPQWKRHRSMSALVSGKEGDSLSLKIKRGQEQVDASLAFANDRPATPRQRKKIEKVVNADQDDGDIYYVDLGRVTPEDVRPMIKDFADARGIIFDLRGYPRGTQFLFQHMTDEHMQSAKWQVPQQIHPDRVDMKEIETRGRWEMPPKKPRFQGEFVFLTNGSACVS